MEREREGEAEGSSGREGEREREGERKERCQMCVYLLGECASDCIACLQRSSIGCNEVSRPAYLMMYVADECLHALPNTYPRTAGVHVIACIS